MKASLFHILLCLALPMLVGCASYKTKYTPAAAQWQQDTVSPKAKLVHTMYLLGDAGSDAPENPAPVLAYLKTVLPQATKNSSIVFLGDNIYEYGMPPKEDAAERAVAEYRILSQLEALDSFKGRPVFIPGNHDWRGWGLSGLKRQQKFVDRYLNEQHGIKDKDDWEDYFLPKDGCSGAEVVELNDDVVLLVIDSEWWLRDWDKEPGMNNGCEVKNRAAFKFMFENMVRKYRKKKVVIAMHHPLYTYGSHGGGFSARQHLFPLTDINKNLYVPLPVIGTLGVAYRSLIGSRQDVANQHYRQLRAAIMAAVKKNGNFIFAAGHEHTLQYIEQDSQSVIVSGAGSKTMPVRLGSGSQFASGHPGFSTISFYDDGETLIDFYEVGEKGATATKVFQKKLQKPILQYEATDSAFALYQELPDSVLAPVTKDEVPKTSGLGSFLLGTHYAELYRHRYEFPTLNFTEYKGGITTVKLGGGNQTNSLRVADSSGRDYVLRGLDKDVSRLLPFPFNKVSDAQYLARQNFLSTLPFAPLAVANLADVIDVYHTNPGLYYVPVQPALGDYNGLFGNAISLVEERPAGKKWKNAEWFGNPKKMVGTDDMLDNLHEDDKYRVDQSWALRTRLLDFLVGDWDRHDDQWAWSAIELKDGGKIYRPIPRDRDQAFSRYDGFVVALARNTMPFLRQLQVYGPTIANRKWNTWSARLFDRSFLTELDWPQWQEQVQYVQQHLTDSAINAAFANWPDTAKQLVADQLKAGLKARRADLESIARTHYEFINRTVTIVGSDEEERFIISRIDDDHTAVQELEISKKGKEKGQLFYRVFDNRITKYINVYGLGGDDEFIVNGDVSKSIKVRLIGGQGKDLFVDSSHVKNGSRKTLVYDDLRKNTIVAGDETKDRRTSQYRYNVYDRRDYASEYDILASLPIIGINPDDGFILGANFNYITYGFKKEPYKTRHQFGASYAFGTHSFTLNYTGDYTNALGRFDLRLEGLYHGPNFAFNYAGIGNDTKRPIDDPNYYRVRQSGIYLSPSIKKSLGINGFVSLGPFLQIVEIEPTANRIITDSVGNFKSNIYDKQYYGGARFVFDINSVDNLLVPHSGIKFRVVYNYINSLQNNHEFSSLRSSVSFYKGLDRKENFVLVSQLGAGFNFGGGYEFFQMPSIGGDQGLRGFRTERFYGDQSFWHSIDLRVRFGTSYNRVLPFTIGMFGAFDYGRVWNREIPSNTWHHDYGGGLWLSPLDFVTLSIGAYLPEKWEEESSRFVFKMGFGF